MLYVTIQLEELQDSTADHGIFLRLIVLVLMAGYVTIVNMLILDKYGAMRERKLRP